MGHASVRPATLEDTAAICGIHCSNVAEWFRRLPDGTRQAAEYSELTVRERFALGGPWMSPETCQIHLMNMLDCGAHVLVAEVGGRTLATAEIFIGDEPAPFARNAHLSILYVHARHHRRGLGSALMDAALQLATKAGCDTFSTSPDDEALDFYRRFDLGPFHTQPELEIALPPTLPRMETRPARATEYPGGNALMRLGRYQSSRQEWEQNFWPPYPPELGLRGRDIVKIARDSRLIVACSPTFSDPTKAIVQAWAPPDMRLSEVAAAALAEAAAAGFRTATTLASCAGAKMLKQRFGAVETAQWELWAMGLAG
ncbi:MAG: GNAT family N-acetyltransferase [Armatimonadia bacterium]